jgi:NAD(P)-dependent dehydrogenase (short-subunit alcohol dehydrogenase family)
LDRFGSIDVLVNGAAGNFLATAEKVSTNAVKKVLDIDTVGTFNMSQQVFNQAMKK